MNNIVWEDKELRDLLTPKQLVGLVRLREKALAMRCRSARDSAAMTAGNMLPLFIKERGVDWACLEAKRILTLLIGSQPDKRAFRRATKEFIALLSP